MEKNNKPGAPDINSNIWGSKFPIFGLIVIIFFLSLVGIRACMLGVPLKDVFRNTDPTPAQVDSLKTGR